MDDLPPGYRFYPTEEELVSFYLHNKLNGTRLDLHRVIPLLDIYDFNPWELPLYAGERCGLDGEQWFFFVSRQEREAQGGRPNRLTTNGYWKATGSPSDVYSSNNYRVIGRKRTMVFYVGRAPNGRKTVWKMNEYKAVQSPNIDEASSSSSSSSSMAATYSTPQLREEFSLCRIYKKSKCLRAFDRRPTTVAAQTAAQVAAHHHHRHEATTSPNYQQNPIFLPDHTTHHHHQSLDSSSSGDQMITNNNSKSVESESKPDMAVEGGEPFWDSDEFNWFDI